MCGSGLTLFSGLPLLSTSSLLHWYPYGEAKRIAVFYYSGVVKEEGEEGLGTRPAPG